jgi:hypothetical protein
VIAFPDTIASALAVFDGSIITVSSFLAVASLTVVAGIESQAITPAVA